MPNISSNEEEDSFRVRFLGKPEIPLVVRLFGLYLAMPVTALLGGGAVVALAASLRGKTKSPESWLAIAGCLAAMAAAVVLYQTGRALQNGRRWAVWVTMGLCLLASAVATVFFTDRESWANRAGSIAFFALALPALVAFLVALRNRAAFQPLEEKVRQRVNKILKWGIPSVVLFLTIGYLGLHLAAERYEQSVNARWAALGLNPAELPNRFPRTKANRTARVLTNMVAADDAYSRSTGPESYRQLLEPTAPYARAFELSTPSMSPFKGGWQGLVDILKKPGNDIGEMPAEITGYLDTHRADFELMYQEIRNQPPQWEMDVDLGINAPIPSLIDARSIVNLICLDATNLLRQGKKTEALAALECAWIVSRTYAARPEIISQFIGLNCEKMIVLTLRKMDGVPSEWHARLADPDWLKRFQMSLSWEAHGLTEGAKRFGLAGFDVGNPQNQVPSWKSALNRIFRPLARYWAVEISETYLLIAERAAKTDGCGTDPDPFRDLLNPEDPASRVSSSNQIAVVGLVNINAYWREWIKHRFRFELTDKLLKVKEAANGGALPPNVAGLESAICPDSRWEYKPEPNGFTLTFSRKSGLFDKDNEGEKEGLFRIQWPVGTAAGRQPPAGNRQK